MLPLFIKWHKSWCGGRINYLPFFKPSAFSKLFERLVHEIIINEQHGYTRNKSTTTNLMIFTNTFTRIWTNGCRLMECTNTNFQKSFDKVDHTLLLQKDSIQWYSMKLAQMACILLRLQRSELKPWILALTECSSPLGYLLFYS